MRIIAGTCKGRKLRVPKDDRVRPTPDRIKEAIFSMLLPYIDGETIVADVFAGTGNMGLEALSRGAGKAYFSDVSAENIALIKQNIALCGVGSQSIVIKGDFRYILARLHEAPDIFFLDPPYDDGLMEDALNAIEQMPELTDGALVVCEHRYKQVLPESIGRLHLWKKKKYGTTAGSVYRQEERG